MARKKQEPEKIISAPIDEQPITETLETNYMPYAMSVIVSRAIPEIDGLKPSHRKLLYTMYRMGLLTERLKKSATIVGEVMKLNPHGDATIYETMVRLTTDHEALLHPLVESKGNFGKHYSRDMAYAAHRYTEAKLAGISKELFLDINKNTVKFVDNYDGTLQEPVLLPSAFPNILVNPNQGIAVGMASNICSFNLREVCEAVKAYMKDENADMMDYMLAPDFSTGAYILYNKASLREIYETGKGSFRMRAKYSYDAKNNCIDITEIPYSTTIEAIIAKITELVKAGKLREISDARDEIDLKGFRLTIDLKRGTDPDALMLKLFKLTPLEDSFSCNFNILINSVPQVMGVKQIIGEWVKFRMECTKNSLKYDIDKKTARLHLLYGLKKILLDIDKAIMIIRHTEHEADVVPNLMSGFEIDEIQAEYVADIKLRNLNKEYILRQTADIEKLIDEIDELNDILSSDKKIKKVIANQLTEIAKKYGEERKTQILTEEEIEVYKEESFIEDYPVTVFFTRENYFKKITAQSLRFTTTEHKLKEDDEILQAIETTNNSELLFFSDKCTVYKARTYDFDDTKVSVLGDYLPSILGLEKDENLLYMAVTTDYSGMMLFAFENGKLAKIPVNVYETKTNRKRLIGAYSDKSPICDIKFIQNDGDYVAYSDSNKVLVFNTEKVALKTTKSSQGVQVMKLKKGTKLSRISELESSGITNVQYYSTKNIPATGCFLKDEDSPYQQMTL